MLESSSKGSNLLEATVVSGMQAGKPTPCSRHIGIQYFTIQDWKSNNEIIMHHIPGTSKPDYDLTKPLGWVLHHQHASETTRMWCAHDAGLECISFSAFLATK